MIVLFVLVSCLVLFALFSSGVNAGVTQPNSTQETAQSQPEAENSTSLSISNIPEPGTLAVIGVGLLAMVLRKRRRKTAA